MYTRSAIFEGSILPGREDEFFDILENRLVPIWRRMPHVMDVRLLRPVTRDDEAPEVLLVQQIDYPTREAIAEALSSPVRDEAVEAMKALYQTFSGRHYHYVYEVLVP